MDTMHDEFIGEAVSDIALDSIAGGTYSETMADFDYLFDLGLISRDRYRRCVRIFPAMGIAVDVNFNEAGIDYVWNEREDEPNKYIYKGKEITQKEAHEIMYKYRYPWK